MKFNIKEVKVYDLDGKVLPYQLPNTIGNVIYGNASTIEWDTISRKIHAGEPVELSQEQANKIEQLLMADDTPLVLPIKNALKEYFKTLKTQENIKDSK